MTCTLWRLKTAHKTLVVHPSCCNNRWHSTMFSCIIIYYLLSCTVRMSNWRDNLKKVKRFLFQTLEWQIVHLPPPFCLGVGGKGVRLADVHEWPRKKVWFDPGGCQTQYQATGTKTTCPFTKTWSDEVALAYCNHFFVHIPRCIPPITMERERKSYKDGLAPATSPRHVGLNKSRSNKERLSSIRVQRRAPPFHCFISVPKLPRSVPCKICSLVCQGNRPNRTSQNSTAVESVEHQISAGQIYLLWPAPQHTTHVTTE